jgi:thioesterase III
MDKLLTSKAKIRFQDCDPFNHLNNARYIDYMINAREDQLITHYNLDVFEAARTTGRSWMVASNQIAYISPAVTMETVTIESQLIGFAPKNLLVEIRMWDEQRTRLKALLWVKFIHVDMAVQKAAEHAKHYMQLFNNVVLPVEQAVFEERAGYLMKNQNGK